MNQEKPTFLLTGCRFHRIKHRNRVLRKLGVRSAVELHNKVQTLLLLSLGLISHSAEKSESGPSPESESDASDQTSAETGRRDIA